MAEIFGFVWVELMDISRISVRQILDPKFRKGLF
jgi:hypothetical protein